MKKLIILFILFLQLVANAQPDATLAKNAKLDFAIPDHPAFSILDNNPDNILKPANSQELFSLIYSDFLSGKTAIIPKDLSIEFSPAQLLGLNTITLEDYKKSNCKRILYDAKLSIGAKTSDGDSLHNLAFGLRLTWVDNSALINNNDFIEGALKVLKKDLTTELEFQQKLFLNQEKFNDKTITEENMAIDTAMTNYVHNLYKQSKEASLFNIKSFREQYKNKYWNKFKFETAFAIKLSSADSLLMDNHYSKFQMYNTLAFPVGKSGQWLLGLNISDERHDSLQVTILDSVTTKTDTVKYHVTSETLATRFYAGSNSFKVFLEGSVKYGSDKIMKSLVSLGTEINLTDGLWVLVNVGNTWTSSTDSKIPDTASTSNWYWKVDLRFHLPEKMKL